MIDRKFRSFFLHMNTRKSVGIFALIISTSLSVFAADTMRVTLDDCVLIALQKSEQLKSSKEKFREITEKVKETQTGFLPKISLKANYTRLDEAPYIDGSKLGDMMSGVYAPFTYFAQTDPTGFGVFFDSLMRAQGAASGGGSKIYMGDDQLYGITVTGQQPIFTGFKIINAQKAARYGSLAQEQIVKKTERDLIIAVKKGYYGVLQVGRAVTALDTSIVQVESIVKDLEAMLTQGMVGENDVMKAQVQLYNIQLLRLQAANGIRLAKAALNNTIGLPIETEISLTDNTVEPQSVGLPPMDEMMAKAQKVQYEIKAMEHQREALKKVVAIQKAAYAPNIVAIGNYNIKRPNRENEPEFYNSWDITLALQMNILDWGENYRKTNQVRSQLTQLESGLSQLKSGTSLMIEKSHLSVQEAFEKIQIAKKAVEQAVRSYEITLDKFHYGVVKNTELLESQRTVTQVKIEYSNSIADYYTKKSELEYLLD